VRILRSPFCGSVAQLISTKIAAPLSVAVLLAATGAQAATTPTPKPSPRPSAIIIHLPTTTLHSEVVVEVNKKGQVVRVKSTKPSKLRSFNVQTYGNALQMWIRKPDGTATVGLYRVTYDYNPKTQDVTRRVSLISTGGNWGNDPGAATVMMDLAKKQAAAAHKAQEQQNGKLPSLNEIRGGSTPHPTPAATLPP
jgi:hypothetical protein